MAPRKSKGTKAGKRKAAAASSGSSSKKKYRFGTLKETRLSSIVVHSQIPAPTGTGY